MDAFPLPKSYKFIKEEGANYIFVLEPCYPGYGVTIGNSIRRILLSSLPGAAVTAIKIKGIDHEFSTIPNVKEDVVEIILNLKQLYLKSYSKEPVRLTLKAKGDEEVTAKAILKNDQVEIANPDLHIATLDGKNADLEIELIVEQGRGYVTVEAREDEKLEIGMIAIDAIYTPIKNVNFTVENVRVGKMTNYDKLTLYLTTNGTIDGKDALDQAAKIAVDHFTLLLKDNFGKEAVIPDVNARPETPSDAKIATVQEKIQENNLTPSDLLQLNLSRRAYNALIKNKITSTEQLKTLTPDQLSKMQGLGEKSVKEILEIVGKMKEQQ